MIKIQETKGSDPLKQVLDVVFPGRERDSSSFFHPKFDGIEFSIIRAGTTGGRFSRGYGFGGIQMSFDYGNRYKEIRKVMLKNGEIDDAKVRIKFEELRERCAKQQESEQRAAELAKERKEFMATRATQTMFLGSSVGVRSTYEKELPYKTTMDFYGEKYSILFADLDELQLRRLVEAWRTIADVPRITKGTKGSLNEMSEAMEVAQ